MSYYYSFNEYLKKRFGQKVRRVSLNSGFSCPHRTEEDTDSGCIFCNESGFSLNSGNTSPVEDQLAEGIYKLRRAYGIDKFIAYFQNATGTNASIDELKKCYDVVKKFKEVNSIYISTRPDCVDDEKLDLIGTYNDKYEVWIEYGVQTFHDRTLEVLNRRHTVFDSINAIKATSDRGIKVGAHIILGLPDETSSDMIETAKALAQLPVDGVKLHVLHVLKNTRLQRLYAEGSIKLLSKEKYIENACNFMEYLKPECVMMRLVSNAYKEHLVAPGWINEKIAVIEGIKKEFERRGTFQGFHLSK